MSTILSFDKFQELLSKNGYALVSVYEVKKRIKFLELRTPRLQRSFILYIPKKYKMKSKNDRFKTFKIRKCSTEEDILSYLSEIKGSLLDCDLISISNEFLCLQRNNGDVVTHCFGEENTKTVESADQSPIDKLIDEGKKIEKLLQDDEDEEEGEEIEIEEKGHTENDDVSGLDEDDENVLGVDEDNEEEEVLGVDEDNEEDEEVLDNKEEGLELVNDETPEKKGIELEFETSDAEDIYITPKPKNISLQSRFDNSIPSNIEDSNINIGLIYYSVDLSLFYKKLKDSIAFEKDILAVYDALDDNEIEIRDIKIDEITELSNKLVKKAKDVSEDCKKKSLELKSQILRLSETLDKTEKLKDKIASNTKKFANSKPDIDRLHNQTKTALHDINTEIIRNRESANDVLEIIRISLEELLET
jgi:hypothetical protein